MRVLVAPDTFGRAMSAAEAAEAVAAGWRRRAPADDVVLAAMSDGGEGFVDALNADLDGELLRVVVSGRCGDEGAATALLADTVAYVESAQAVGLRSGESGDADEAERATSYGVGQLIDAAVRAGARTVVVGLGGSMAGDGGAGRLAALGAESVPAGALVGGSSGLGALESVDLTRLTERLAGVRLVGARDRDIPLVGLRGTTSLTGASRGLAADRLQLVDAYLERLADTTDRRLAGTGGAGAGGGMGFAILLAGGSLEDGVSVTAGAVGLADLARRADLVVTGEESFDFASRAGTVVAAIAAIAGAAVRPCIVLADRVLVGSREMRALGVESAYAVADLVDDDPGTSRAERLAALGERVARTWSR
jgi:glycerate kinase